MARQFAALRPPTVSKDKKLLRSNEIETRWKVTFYDHAGKRHRRFSFILKRKPSSLPRLSKTAKSMKAFMHLNLRLESERKRSRVRSWSLPLAFRFTRS